MIATSMTPDPLNHLAFPRDFVEWAEGLEEGGFISLGEWAPGEWVFELGSESGLHHYRFSLSSTLVKELGPKLWKGEVNHQVRQGLLALSRFKATD